MKRTVTFAELIEAGILEIGDGYRAKLSELGGDGPIFLRAASVADGRIDYADNDRFNESIRLKLQSKLGRPGDTVVTTKGASTGRAAFVSADAPEFAYSPHLSYWRSRKPDELDPLFLRYWARSAEFTTQLGGLAASTDMSLYLSLIDQRRLRITLPARDDQRRMGEFFGALDDKIGLNRRMNETLEALLAATFDRTTASAGTRPLNELACASREAIDPSLSPDEQFDHFSIPAFDGSRSPVVEPGSAIRSNKLLVHPDAVLVSKLNPRIQRVWLPSVEPERRAICSTEFLVLRPLNVPRELVYAAVRSRVFAVDLKSLASGTSGSHQRARAEDVLSLEVPMPNEPEAFVTLAKPLLERIAANRRESRTLAALRDALLPKLISGELRIRGAERVVDQAP